MLALVYHGPGQKQLDERAKPASEAVRHTESGFILVECFGADHHSCRLDGHCRLKGALREAMDHYLKVLDGFTLADLVPPASGTLDGQRVQFLPGLPRLPETAAPRKQVSASGESR